ncbi:uncharacterized, partial [Tachysurus ichikawai]
MAEVSELSAGEEEEEEEEEDVLTPAELITRLEEVRDPESRESPKPHTGVWRYSVTVVTIVTTGITVTIVTLMPVR